MPRRKSVSEAIRAALTEELEDTLKVGLKLLRARMEEGLSKAADKAARAVVLDAHFEDVDPTRFLPGTQEKVSVKKEEKE